MIDFYKGKSVFIAGGAGMTGQSLIKQLLERGANVVASQFINRKIDTIHKNLQVVNIDLFDQDKVISEMKNVDMVFIAAAKAIGAKNIMLNPMDLVSYNLKLQFGLMECAYKSKIDRLGFISSSYVYPHTGKPNVESEGFMNNPCSPKSHGLGWMMRYLETVCKSFHMDGLTKFAIIRPAAMYGPHDNFNLESCHAIPALIRKFAEKMNPFEVWGDGSEIRCHTYIDDLVSGLLMATERYAVAEPVNICTNEFCSIRDIVIKLCDITRFTPEIVFNKNKPTTMSYKVSSSSLAYELFGWKAETSVWDGLKKTMDWFNNNWKQN